MFNAKIITLTPVHVGNGKLLMKDADYICYKDNIGIIDPQKLLSIIGTENIDRWINMVMKPEKPDAFLQYLLQRKKDFSVQDISTREVAVFADNASNCKSLKAQLHTGTGLPLIPGSSIKGAIRTALFSNFIKNKYHDQQIPEAKLFPKNNRRSYSDKQLNEELLGNNPNTDLLRFLQVGDAEFEFDTVAINMVIMNQGRSNWSEKPGQTQLTEALGVESVARFRMKINNSLFDKNKERIKLDTINYFPESLNKLLELVNNHTIQLIEEELDFWNDLQQDIPEETFNHYLDTLEDLLKQANNINKGEAIMRLGYGSGWDFITGAWLRDPGLIDDKVFKDIIRAIRRKPYPETFTFPKTRKFSEYGVTLGFVKVLLDKSQ